jgi:hypothetical protein
MKNKKFRKTIDLFKFAISILHFALLEGNQFFEAKL